MEADPNPSPEDDEAGTTLVELLVALALLSLIALFIGEGIGAVRRMAPVGQRIDQGMELTAAREHLRRTLGEAVADLGLVGGAPFLGGPAQLRFLAPADPILEIGGLNAVTLALAPRQGGGLDFVERRDIASGDLALGASRTVLVPDVRSLRFAYGEATADKGFAWREEWRRTGALPALVAIELEFGPADRRRFARLLVHPVASPLPEDGQRPGTADEANARLLPEG